MAETPLEEFAYPLGKFKTVVQCLMSCDSLVVLKVISRYLTKEASEETKVGLFVLKSVSWLIGLGGQYALFL